jgi:hypothetical protein
MTNRPMNFAYIAVRNFCPRPGLTPQLGYHVTVFNIGHWIKYLLWFFSAMHLPFLVHILFAGRTESKDEFVFFGVFFRDLANKFLFRSVWM